MRIVSLALALALAAPVPPAAAAGAPPPPAASAQDEDLVVTARRLREQTVHDFIAALSGPTVGGPTDPIGRLDGAPVCPGTVGLAKERNAAIDARIRRVAGAVGMKTGPAGCRPNIVLIFTRDKEAMIAALRRGQGDYFRDGSGADIQLPKQPGPVAAWHVERVVDRHGQAVAYDEDNGYYVLASSTAGTSPIVTAVRTAFAAAVVVIETGAIAGLTTDQIADYAAMRAFTRADPARVKRLGANTILSAIEAPEGTPVPLTLTQWDLAYLRALASTPLYNRGARQRTDIRRAMMKELTAANVTPSGG